MNELKVFANHKMCKLRYSGENGKYKDLTRKVLLELLKDVKVPNKSRMSRIQLIMLHRSIDLST